MNDVAQQVVGRMRVGDHHCLSFDTDAEQREVLTSYIRNGLARHEQVIYFAAVDPVTVFDLLRESGLAPARFSESGQLRVMGPREGYLAYLPFDPDVMVAVLRRNAGEALAAGYRALRITGEPSVLRGRPGSDKWTDYERKAADVYGDTPVMGMCQYDRRIFSPAEIAAVEALHTHTVVPDPVYEDARLSIFPTYHPRGFRMVGELDLSQVTAWFDWIHQAGADVEEDLLLNLVELRFVDLAGVRMLAELSDRLAHDGRRLLLQDLRPSQSLVFCPAGCDHLPNLVLTETQR
ncbi:MEDS: MEthanogen/methylotroph, DcmR Sensory domain [Actinopolymorpha cephalotaxi]|uniref:Anti-anti-sigma regulatory factor n=1 Tax=Actinopolymorpha cephalotaxi TaxID=504797 RepID=A0A1I2PE02_9ACTN|nr:MEDS domain-containing protein [Actinopolymorpha cephalotaxi]NYH83727.1 anti-anti-sigma regulatory factor [Actinopolymorpha cephalotaxi]SFG11896.1 MEDS: MEthanogen/methylotroph, DcmR Sensory domain [Actinopolymorpha cephalotaxi]